MEAERRKRRSQYRDQSLSYWFASAAVREDQLGFVLADTAGLLIASNLPPAAAEEVAAQTPFIYGNEQHLADFTDSDRFAVKVHRVGLGNDQAYLCVIGKDEVTAVGLEVAVGGVKRILEYTN